MVRLFSMLARIHARELVGDGAAHAEHRANAEEDAGRERAGEHHRDAHRQRLHADLMEPPPEKKPSAPAAFTAFDAKTPVSSAPTMPATP